MHAWLPHNAVAGLAYHAACSCGWSMQHCGPLPATACDSALAAAVREALGGADVKACRDDCHVLMLDSSVR
jgi:hypothetical protein